MDTLPKWDDNGNYEKYDRNLLIFIQTWIAQYRENGKINSAENNTAFKFMQDFDLRSVQTKEFVH